MEDLAGIGLEQLFQIGIAEQAPSQKIALLQERMRILPVCWLVIAKRAKRSQRIPRTAMASGDRAGSHRAGGT